MGMETSRILDAGDPLLLYASGSVYREKQVGFLFLDLVAGLCFLELVSIFGACNREKKKGIGILP